MLALGVHHIGSRACYPELAHEQQSTCVPSIRHSVSKSQKCHGRRNVDAATLVRVLPMDLANEDNIHCFLYLRTSLLDSFNTCTLTPAERSSKWPCRQATPNTLPILSMISDVALTQADIRTTKHWSCFDQSQHTTTAIPASTTEDGNLSDNQSEGHLVK